MKASLFHIKTNNKQNLGLGSASQIASFSRITRDDKKLLQAAVRKFRPESTNYEDSWGYIIQATRNKGFKWYDPANGYLIFFGRKSENDQTLIVPNYFADSDSLVRILNQINLIEKPPQVILKNIHTDEVANYNSYNFYPYHDNQYWSDEARFDDQTYPQLIVDLKRTYTAQGKSFRKLRSILNKKPHLSIRPYRNSDKNAVLNLLTLKDSSSQKHTNRVYYTSHKMYPTADLGKRVIINELTGELIGFTATSDITSQTTTLVAAIFKTGVKVASIWGIYQTLAIKYHEGFEKINLGGYETIGSYNFMREKFRPVEQIERIHLIYASKQILYEH
jgi:hypothetical protein